MEKWNTWDTPLCGAACVQGNVRGRKAFRMVVVQLDRIHLQFPFDRMKHADSFRLRIPAAR